MTSIPTAPSSLTMASIHDFALTIGQCQQGGEGPLTLDLSQVAAPDLSLLQVVESARAQARVGGGSVRLSAPAAGPLAALLGRAGFTDAMTPDDLDFWFHGDLPQ
ncbi:STAS domain-containing protein [uncultured Sphingomonas sp.]|uniref:STAS domain-containing protein n=1 Tax=uncultured Sphingomonas sp. TaxID=158754 RepID=UPI0025DC560F|nr:STAS domain-containing protein [uncultured Sphingomonas sp.]